MDRRKYWDENYLKYWKDKVQEANSEQELRLNKNDIKTISDDIVFDYCDMIPLKEGDAVLDFGCGFCRTYDYFENRKVKYFGIDISQAMISESKKNHTELLDRLFVAEGEKLPFQENMFDFLLCFGVFDACYQEIALYEMLRVLKIGGILLLTGKNDNYYADDEKAIIAEEKAREKGHPNYFTDTVSMIKQLKERNIEIRESFYFERRGNFSTGTATKEMPKNFYEYLLIMQKKEEGSNRQFDKFSSDYSKTFKEKV